MQADEPGRGQQGGEVLEAFARASSVEIAHDRVPEAASRPLIMALRSDPMAARWTGAVAPGRASTRDQSPTICRPR